MSIQDKVTELINKYDTMAIDVVCEIIEELEEVQEGFEVDLRGQILYWEKVKDILTSH